MAIQNPPAYIQARSDHSAGSFRQALAVLSGATEGVGFSSSMSVVERSTGANMSVDVLAGTALVRDSRVISLAGMYAVANDSRTNLAIAPADTLPRIDLVIVRVQDSTDNPPDLMDEASFEVITGTAAGSPVAPTLPSAYQAYVLAEVTVPANASSILDADITDTREQVSLLSRVNGLRTDVDTLDSNVGTITNIGGGINLGAQTLTLGDDATGNAIIQTDSGVTALQLRNQNGDLMLGFVSDTTIRMRPETSAASTNLLRSSSAGGAIGSIQVSSSSERYKKDIETLSVEDARSLIGNIRVITYKSKFDIEGGTDEGAGQQWGFSAEQIHSLNPELTPLDDEDKPSGVDTEAITAHLVATVQDLMQEVAELKAQLNG